MAEGLGGVSVENMIVTELGRLRQSQEDGFSKVATSEALGQTERRLERQVQGISDGVATARTEAATAVGDLRTEVVRIVAETKVDFGVDLQAEKDARKVAIQEEKDSRREDIKALRETMASTQTTMRWVIGLLISAVPVGIGVFQWVRSLIPT